jgi:hypothetical protein
VAHKNGKTVCARVNLPTTSSCSNGAPAVKAAESNDPATLP